MEPNASIKANLPGNREVEYTQAVSYIHHMYDTRHHIFQFGVALNTALLAGVFQFVDTDPAKLALSAIGGVVTLAILLMARRSSTYTRVLERYTAELETSLGFGLVRETAARMPKGIDSTFYFLFVDAVAAVMWCTVSIYFIRRLLTT